MNKAAQPWLWQDNFSGDCEWCVSFRYHSNNWKRQCDPTAWKDYYLDTHCAVMRAHGCGRL